jgi:hypothetical protein
LLHLINEVLYLLSVTDSCFDLLHWAGVGGGGYHAACLPLCPLLTFVICLHRSQGSSVFPQLVDMCLQRPERKTLLQQLTDIRTASAQELQGELLALLGLVVGQQLLGHAHAAGPTHWLHKPWSSCHCAPTCTVLCLYHSAAASGNNMHMLCLQQRVRTGCCGVPLHLLQVEPWSWLKTCMLMQA